MVETNEAELASINRAIENEGPPGAGRNDINQFNRHNEQHPGELNSNKPPGSKYTIIYIIFAGILLTYSVVVSTMALIIAMDNNSSTSTSCNCTVDSFTTNTEDTNQNGIQDSDFCDVVSICASADVILTNDSTLTPSTLPTVTSATSNPTKNPSSAPTRFPISADPTQTPSQNPSQNPTQNASQSPTKNPSGSPSSTPTSAPSKSPTYFDGYFIGDYKYSFRSFDHGLWKACNGELLEIDGVYEALFDIIGYTFGEYTDPISNQSYFQLPNISDSIMGIAGNNHAIGTQIGVESLVLVPEQMPNHTHYMFGGTGSDWNTFGVWDPDSTATSSGYPDEISGSGVSTLDLRYGITGSTTIGQADQFRTSIAGHSNPQAISVMQPTAFYSNLFIYTGVAA